MNAHSRAPLLSFLALILSVASPSLFAENGLTGPQQSSFLSLTGEVFGKESPQYRMVNASILGRSDALSQSEFFHVYNRVIASADVQTDLKVSHYIGITSSLYQDLAPTLEEFVVTFEATGPAKVKYPPPAKKTVAPEPVQPSVNQILFFERHLESFGSYLPWMRALPIARTLMLEDWTPPLVINALRRVFAKTVNLDLKTSERDLNYLIYDELLLVATELYPKDSEKTFGGKKFIVANREKFASWSPAREHFMARAEHARAKNPKVGYFFLMSSDLPQGLSLPETLRTYREAAVELSTYQAWEKPDDVKPLGDWSINESLEAYLANAFPERLGAVDFAESREEILALDRRPKSQLAVLKTALSRADDPDTFREVEGLMIANGYAAQANEISWQRRNALAKWLDPAELAAHFETRIPAEPDVVDAALSETNVENFLAYVTSLIADTNRWDVEGLDRFVRTAGQALFKFGPTQVQIETFMRAIFARNVPEARIEFERAASGDVKGTNNGWYELLALKLDSGLPPGLSFRNRKDRDAIRTILLDGIANAHPADLDVGPIAGSFLQKVCLNFVKRRFPASVTVKLLILATDEYGNIAEFENAIIAHLNARTPADRRYFRDALNEAVRDSHYENEILNAIAAGLPPRVEEIKLALCVKDLFDRGRARFAKFVGRPW